MQTMTLTPPRRLSDVPGLGPIRVRALQKAGFTSLSALQAADLETLMAVPGLSEIKARYIQTYLAPFTDLPSEPEPNVLSKPVASAAQTDVTDPGNGLKSWMLPALDAGPLGQEAQKAVEGVVELLLAPESSCLRARLVVALVRFARHSGTLARRSSILEAKDRDRALRKLQRLHETMEEAHAPEGIGRKAQARLADDLADFDAWLSKAGVKSDFGYEG